MKDILKYIWKNGLLPRRGLKTTTGEAIEFVSPGEENGELFTDATIIIGDRQQNGSVALHPCRRAREISDIEQNIILLLTGSPGESGTIPQLHIKCPQEVIDAYKQIIDGNVPCAEIATGYSSINLHAYMSRLLMERIEEKADRIGRMYEQCDKRWNDLLFKLLARSFGFGIQGEAFEEWATLLNMQAVYKHRNSREQVEAILFGQAGLLDADSIPAYYREEGTKSEHYTTLAREYRFLKNKFALKEMEHKRWNYGNSTPHIRISRLAALLCNERLSINTIEEHSTIGELRNLLQAQPSTYWQHRTHFGGTVTIGCGDISNRQLDVLIINCIVPILYCYGRHRERTDLCNTAEDLLHKLNGEENSITRKWARAGVRINCAADSQALIQLNNAYCRKKRCPECRFAQTFLKETIAAAQEADER